MRRIAIIILFIIGLVSIDFFSKKFIEWLAMISSDFEWKCHYIIEGCLPYIPVIGQYLGIQLSYNSGIAFSLPITGIPLQIITILLVSWLWMYYFRSEYPKHSSILDIGYSLILAWALSHAYERIFVGHVIDFISVKYFAILNFADIFISIGACFIFFVYYVRKQ